MADEYYKKSGNEIWKTGQIITADKMNNIERAIDSNEYNIDLLMRELSYQNTSITSFTVTSPEETITGSSIDIEAYSGEKTFSFTCNHNKTGKINTIKIDNTTRTDLDTTSPITFTKIISGPNGTSGWSNSTKIYIEDEGKPATAEKTSATKTATINFYDYCYYGCSVKSDLIEWETIKNFSKVKMIGTTKKISFDVTTQAGQYLYIIFPARLNAVDKNTFILGSGQTTMETVGEGAYPYTINDSGFREGFYIYKTKSLQTGSSYPVKIND